MLLQNDGAWTFTDATALAGLDQNNERFSLACAWEDYDDDGDPDLYVANDFGRNNLYRNDGGKFTDVAPAAGVESLAAGRSVSWADYDRDGKVDLHVGNVSSSAGQRVSSKVSFRPNGDVDVIGDIREHARGSALFENAGDGTFRDVSAASGLASSGWAWGSSFVDIDNDGWSDVIVANGNVTGETESDLSSFFWRQVVARSPDGDQIDSDYSRGWFAFTNMMREGASWSARERNRCFLGNAGESFVDVSALSGADFDQDGRAMAIVDWDLDGRLDLWTTNRNAPRVRVLRNSFETPNAFVAFWLEGKTCNRDAIGARVELHLKDAPLLVETLRAGGGFLSQSTKWIHFGVGVNATIEKLVVRWPGGETEEFGAITAGERYRITQGGEATEWQSAPQALEAGELVLPAATELARVVLDTRLPLIGVVYSDTSGRELPVSDLTGPKLVNFWTTGSANSIADLQALNGAELGALEILALNVDDEGKQRAAQQYLREISWDHGSGFASEVTVEVLDIIQQYLLDRRRALPLPSSFLLDEKGEIAVIYKGPLSISTLERDLAGLSVGPDTVRENSVPFSGIWRSRTGRPPIFQIAGRLREFGHADIAARYLAGLGVSGNGQAELDRMNLNVALTLARDGNHTEAIRVLERLIESDPDDDELRRHLGNSLFGIKDYEAAEQSFRECSRLNPKSSTCHQDLGILFLDKQDLASAKAEFLAAVALDDRNAVSHFNLAVMFDSEGNDAEAKKHAEKACAAKPDYLLAWRVSGIIDLRAQRFGSAATSFGKALEIDENDEYSIYGLGVSKVYGPVDVPGAQRLYERLVAMGSGLAPELKGVLDRVPR